MKKKKKKVVVQDDAPAAEPEVPASASAPTEPAAESSSTLKAPEAEAVDSGAATPVDGGADGAADPGADLFADMKKKKKKKKDLPADFGLDMDLAADVPTASTEGLEKKKKSKKQASDFARELGELDAEQQAAEEGDVPGEEGELGDDPFAQGGDAEGEDGDAEVGAWVKEGRQATYPELLRRFFTLLHQHNPELAGEKRRYTIVPPQVAREGTKKTMFSNITDICRRMHRQPEHVIQFLYSELGTQGSVDGSQRLIMKGRYTQKQIENVLRKYIVEYVTCKICKSPDTLLGKENRLYFMTCESCGSRRSVSAIKAGYQAQIGKRIKAA